MNERADALADQLADALYDTIDQLAAERAHADRLAEAMRDVLDEWPEDDFDSALDRLVERLAEHDRMREAP